MLENQLSQKINLIKKEAIQLNQDIIFDFTLDGKSVIVANKDAYFVGLISQSENTGEIVTHKIDVPKWLWAEQEGFTRDEMAETPLKQDIFIPINSDILVNKLMLIISFLPKFLNIKLMLLYINYLNILVIYRK